MDIMYLVIAIQSYWRSELLSVGIKVLETLEGLRKLKSNGSAFHQSTSALYICGVSSFLFTCQYLNLTPPFDKMVASSLKISCEDYFNLVFPLDWRKSISEELMHLRMTDLSVNVLDGIILDNVDIKGELDYWTIGRVMMTCLGSRTSVVLYERLIIKLESKPMWKLFVRKLRDVGFREDLVLPEFFLALKDAFRADRKVWGPMSPDSFVRLFDRLLFVASLLCQSFYTAKSSFAGWFTYLHSSVTPTILSPKPKILKHIISFYVEIVQEILYDRDNTFAWGGLSTDDCAYYHKILALKLVMMLALILLEESDYSQVLLDLLTGSSNIADLLPEEFVSSLLRRREGHSLNLNPELVAEAFMRVEDPLVIVCRGDLSPKIHAPCAIFVNLNKTKEEIMHVLFPRKNNTLGVNTSHNVVVGTILEPPSQVDANRNVNPVNEGKGELQIKQKVLKEISKFITEKKGILPLIFSAESAKKTELDQKFCALAAALEGEKFCTVEDITLVLSEFSKLKVLSEACVLSLQTSEHSSYVKNVDGILDWLNTSRLTVDAFLKRYGSPEPTAGQMVVSECSGSSKTEAKQKGDDAKNKRGKGNKQKGKQSNGKKI